jgi:phage replication-related protein YjqB (UPF0714/DUF867 family)
VFADLLAHPGVTETCELRSSFGFMAIHGGSLERGTAELARAAASGAGASLYAVEQPDDFRWHLPSHLADPAASRALARFLDHVEVVISLHGYGRDDWWTRILLGGGNRALAARLADRIRAALPGFEAIDELGAIPAELRGVHPANPANRPRGGGVQVELPPRVRNVGPRGRPELAAALVDALVAVAA